MVSGSAVAVTAVGGIILYSAAKNAPISKTLQSFLAGKSVPTQTDFVDTGGISQVPSGPIASGGGGTSTTNRATGRLIAASYGWVGAEWTALDNLYTRESGWQSNIMNTSSGAFGITQALGHGTGSSTARNVKVRFPDGSTAVRDVNEYPSMLANSGNAVAQIRWGYNYIHERYGKPSVAWAHELANSWY